jgi:tubulin monoglycylase TTLL3/8
LIIKDRKFDIRIWVLVTDWNPLTVWVWREPYIRFPPYDYDPTNMDRFVHLTNNAIQKKKKRKADEEAPTVPEAAFKSK